MQITLTTRRGKANEKLQTYAEEAVEDVDGIENEVIAKLQPGTFEFVGYKRDVKRGVMGYQDIAGTAKLDEAFQNGCGEFGAGYHVIGYTMNSNDFDGYRPFGIDQGPKGFGGVVVEAKADGGDFHNPVGKGEHAGRLGIERYEAGLAEEIVAGCRGAHRYKMVQFNSIDNSILYVIFL